MYHSSFSYVYFTVFSTEPPDTRYYPNPTFNLFVFMFIVSVNIKKLYLGLKMYFT